MTQMNTSSFHRTGRRALRRQPSALHLLYAAAALALAAAPPGVGAQAVTATAAPLLNAAPVRVTDLAIDPTLDLVLERGKAVASRL